MTTDNKNNTSTCTIGQWSSNQLQQTNYNMGISTRN